MPFCEGCFKIITKISCAACKTEDLPKNITSMVSNWDLVGMTLQSIFNLIISLSPGNLEGMWFST